MNNPIITVRDMNLWYGQTQALKNINLDIPEKSITALIGPSGCGKSTFLKSLNRMQDLVPGVKITGDLRYEGRDIFEADVRCSDSGDHESAHHHAQYPGESEDSSSVLPGRRFRSGCR